MAKNVEAIFIVGDRITHKARDKANQVLVVTNITPKFRVGTTQFSLHFYRYLAG